MPAKKTNNQGYSNTSYPQKQQQRAQGQGERPQFKADPNKKNFDQNKNYNNQRSEGGFNKPNFKPNTNRQNTEPNNNEGGSRS